MLTSQFAFKAPETIEELLSEIDANPDAAILSGGHTLIGLLKSEAIDPDIIISTEKIQGLKEIKQESDGSVVIGSSVTLSALLDHSAVGAKFPS
jgi:carbon-monoxide dehydrogenase medium subunit